MNLPEFLTEATAKAIEELIAHFDDIQGMIDGAFYEELGEDTLPDSLPTLQQCSYQIMLFRHALQAQLKEAIANEEEQECIQAALDEEEAREAREELAWMNAEYRRACGF